VTPTPALVSIVTPYFNTEDYLAECVESVLAQTYGNWEYILVDNRSTDRSRAIAERYARSEPRIRLFDTPEHLTQIRNYEGALRRMSPEARYCKIVQADDRILPECIARMVAVAEANPQVGIVSSYQLFGEEERGRGLPADREVFSGREIGRRQLQNDEFYFGTPTSIMLRADIIRSTTPFFDESLLHPDTEACYRILTTHDMGFVHQDLTFARVDSDSISSRLAHLAPNLPDHYICLKKFGRQFLDENEYKRYLSKASSRYLLFLFRSLLERRDESFWQYHRHALSMVDCTFRCLLRPQFILLMLGKIVLNPGKTAARAAVLVRQRAARR
jgi:glycosyltransferase involved in cell wall biosynthesis